MSKDLKDKKYLKNRKVSLDTKERAQLLCNSIGFYMAAKEYWTIYQQMETGGNIFGSTY